MKEIEGSVSSFQISKIFYEKNQKNERKKKEKEIDSKNSGIIKTTLEKILNRN